MKNNNKVTFGWGGGMTNLYLHIQDGKPSILDCEHDREELFKLCGGGETTYVSCSGCTGSGYLNSLGMLMPLGIYRTDTTYNNEQWFVSLGTTKKGKEIEVAVPYASHQEEKADLLQTYPTVIKVGDTIIYCDFEKNFVEILTKLFSGEEIPETLDTHMTYSWPRGRRTLKKIFTAINSYGDACEREEVLDFYNLCYIDETPNPWEFYCQGLSTYGVENYTERIFQLLSVEKLSDGTFVKTFKINNEKYRGEILDGNPLETGKLTAGWQRLADDVLVRFYNKNNEVHLVAYASAQEMYGKLARRFANRMGENEEFVSFVSEHRGEYVEFELIVPKFMYALNKATYLTEVRKGLAKKVKEDVTWQVRQWINKVNDQAILEAIPDDMVVTIDDSLDAGNCRPGTEDFINRFFPGQTQATARELKKHESNYNVMRIFRYLATKGRFSWKETKLA